MIEMNVTFLDESMGFPLMKCPSNFLKLFPNIKMKIVDKKLEEKKLKSLASVKRIVPFYSTYLTDGKPGLFFVTDQDFAVFSFSCGIKDSINHASAMNEVGILHYSRENVMESFRFEEDTDKLPGAEKSATLARYIVTTLAKYPKEKILRKFEEFREKYEPNIFS